MTSILQSLTLPNSLGEQVCPNKSLCFCTKASSQLTAGCEPLKKEREQEEKKERETNKKPLTSNYTEFLLHVTI